MSHYLLWPVWITIPVGGLAAGAIGILFGYPFSRLRTLYFAMGSLFFGVAVIYLIQALRITGGYLGLPGVAPIFRTGSKIPYYYFFLGLSIVCIGALYRFEFSRIGVTLKAVAQSYLLASSVGVNESRYRILAIGAGCFVVGLIGAAFAHYYGLVTPASFNLGITLWITMYVLIGGIGSFAGPIIGTPLLYFVPQYFLSDLRAYSPYIPAAMLVIIAYLMPKGLVGLFSILKSRFLDRLAARRAREIADVAGN
jgi:branched-chain amino acid transport system permease protein